MSGRSPQYRTYDVVGFVAVLMPPSEAGGYHVAMFTDPDGFAIGLVEPFGH